MGVDIGGTFTDGVVIDPDGVVHTFKELSTPKDPSVGLYNVIRKAASAFGKNLAEFLPELDFLAHGTTVATNTLLTGAGAKTGLILTRGFRDTLEMRRAHKENIWDLYLRRYGDDPVKLCQAIFPVAKTEIGNIGTLICAEGSFPEAARGLALNGAEIIWRTQYPEPWMGNGIAELYRVGYRVDGIDIEPLAHYVPADIVIRCRTGYQVGFQTKLRLQQIDAAASANRVVGTQHQA